MLFNRLGLFVVAGVLVFSSLSPAQESDYNDVLKQTLKEDAPPPPPPKRIVKKRIKKVVKKSTLPAKTTKIAQAIDSSAGTISVKVKDNATDTVTIKPNNITSANESDSAPSLGEAENNAPKYSYQQQPYQPIFILQPTQAPQAAPAAVATAPAGQVQPTTNVDATAVPEPKSEQLRHQREDMEHQTENKLIEKLEDDRLKSEKDRADRLFAAPVPVSSPAQSPAPAVAPVAGVVAVEVPPQPAQSPAPVLVQPVMAGPAPEPIASPAPEVVKSDVNAVAVIIPPSDTMKGENSAKVDENAVKKEDEEKRFSVGAVAGLPSYPSANNINSLYTLGVMGTYKFENRFALQTGFDYSRFNIQNATYCPYCSGGTLVEGLNQYDFNVGLNYNILPGKITPVVGVLLDYARRSYSDVADYGYTYGLTSGSNALNAGLMAGLDVELSKNLILGFQFQYLFNVSYWTDSPLAYGLYGNLYGTPVEQLSYYMATLNLRFMF
jgi:hypothetical protein